MTSRLSIIIPTRNEVGCIEQAVASTLSGLQGFEAEVLVCDGASTDGTVELVRNMARKDPRIKLVENPAGYSPHGMNAGLRNSTGDYIFVVSAHASYSKGYFQTLLEATQRLGAACSGGSLRTEVKEDNAWARAIRAVLGDPFGVGNAHFRIGTEIPRQVDTVAYGCYPRWVFERWGCYDERLHRNQDIELNKRVRAAGGSIWLIPAAVATYYARPSLGAFLSNQFQNGRWNLLTVALTGSWSSISARHLIPGCFVISLFIPGIAALHDPRWGVPAVLSLAAYMPLLVWRGFRLRQRGASAWRAMATLFLLHIAYGSGTLAGGVQAPAAWIRGRNHHNLTRLGTR
ncbi:MAG: glycosyltransferase family 2 protein [Holophagaceae bacterium]|nr:glycosyltransferase family 2 protein [Holophagaceae bacterium]